MKGTAIMAIQIGNYNFEGPFRDSASLREQSGVYAVLGGNGTNSWKVVDVGESEQIRTRVSNHDRANCWGRNRGDGLAYAAYYCTERDRMRIEQELRTKYNPPCGDR
jgi:hypothetical protein